MAEHTSGRDRLWSVPENDVVARRVGRDLVIVNLRTNLIFSLNETGARVWELVAEGYGYDEIESIVTAEFKVEPARLEREVAELRRSLHEAELVRLDESSDDVS